MNGLYRLRNWLTSDQGLLFVMALAFFLLHLLSNGQYGWHRDELANLDDARYLDWGYVAYPPVTPAATRLGLALFGSSLVGVRLVAALSHSLAILLTGLMARRLGGGRTAQLTAGFLTGIALAGLETKFVKNVKWIAGKCGCKNIVLHSFTHLAEASGSPQFAESFLQSAAARLRSTGYEVTLTPFGWVCEWDLSVYGESLAKVYKSV